MQRKNFLRAIYNAVLAGILGSGVVVALGFVLYLFNGGSDESRIKFMSFALVLYALFFFVYFTMKSKKKEQ